MVLTTKIHCKMQRKKLYNLHKTSYFLVAFIVFKMNKVLRDQILDIAKINRTEFSLFLKTIAISFTVKIVEFFTLYLIVYFGC
jgi:hypothetical protein